MPPPTTAAEAVLKSIRERIDALDERIQALITERAICAREVAAAKRAAGETANFYRPEREAQILEGVIARNQGPLSDEAMVRVFREIMSACRALQEPLRIAFLGPLGTFSQTAALTHFGHAIHPLPMGSIGEVFREVEATSAHYGVVPVENSTEGGVGSTLDMFVRSPLHVCGEVELRVHHHLLARDASMAAITRVYAHQQALAQCRAWLDARLPRAERLVASSNAEGARLVADEPGAAAIAGETAAELYGLTVLAANIEDEPDNTTRFAVIGVQGSSPPTGFDKTSVLFTVHNRPGALYDLLAPLAAHGISMTRVESRPSRRDNWDYVFFVDIEGHREDPRVKAALAEVERRASLFKILGSYPRARL